MHARAWGLGPGPGKQPNYNTYIHTQTDGDTARKFSNLPFTQTHTLLSLIYTGEVRIFILTNFP